MSTRIFLNLGLLALCVSLGWFVLTTHTTPPASTTSDAITSLAANVINDVRIERDGQQVVHLHRNDAGWRVRYPFAAAADGFRIRALLGLASARSSAGFSAADRDLSQYGLEPALAIVRFNDTTLRIGDTDPVAGQRYLLVGAQVHLLDDNWFSQIFGNSTAWLDPRPLPAGSTPTLIKLDDGQWAQPDAALADAWSKARALSVQPRDVTLNWSGQVAVQFTGATASSTPQSIVFATARTDQAFLLRRDDLDVQYRFLTRQGHTLLGTAPPPEQ